MTYGELEIFTDVGVETHYITVLYSLLTLSGLVVKTHGLGSTPVQSVTSVHWRVSDWDVFVNRRQLLLTRIPTVL